MPAGVGLRIYIGQYADDETSLDYLNARYYDPTVGQFLSEDPVFITLGSHDAEQLAGQATFPNSPIPRAHDDLSLDCHLALADYPRCYQLEELL